MSLCYIDHEMRIGDQGSSMNDIDHLFGKLPKGIGVFCYHF